MVEKNLYEFIEKYLSSISTERKRYKSKDIKSDHVIFNCIDIEREHKFFCEYCYEVLDGKYEDAINHMIDDWIWINERKNKANVA